MNIFEAIKAIDEGKIVKSNRGYIYKKVNGCIYGKRYDEINSDFKELFISSFEKEFEIIKESVPFIDAIKAYRDGKTISSVFSDDGNNSIYRPGKKKDNNYISITDQFGDGICAEEILNGKWYIY